MPSTVVEKIVNTTFTVVDAATAPMTAISRTASMVGQSLAGLASPLQVAIGSVGVGAALHGIIQMQSAAEGTTLAIAGTLKAFDAVGDFAEGASLARDVIQQINRDAAALPGSAEEYVEVFRTALPAAMSAHLGTVQDIARFSNQMAAVGLANQIDSQQVARDTALMLRGHAGGQVRTWQVLMPLIGKSAEQFNAMSAPARGAALRGALQRYGPLLSQFNNTWDSIYGTTQSWVTTMARGATTPIFDAAKDGLRQVNSWLERNNEAITRTGRALAQHMVNPLYDAARAAREIAQGVQEDGGPGNWLRQNGSLLSAAGGAAGMALGVPGLGLVISGLLHFATNTEAVTAVMGSLHGAFMSVQPAVDSVFHAFDTVSTVLGNIFVDTLPGLFSGVGHVVESVSAVIQTYFDRLSVMATTLGERLHPVLERLSPLFDQLGRVVGHVIEMIGTLQISAVEAAFTSLVTGLERYTPEIISVVQRIIHALDVMDEGLYRFIRFLNTIPGVNIVYSRTGLSRPEQTTDPLAALAGGGFGGGSSLEGPRQSNFFRQLQRQARAGLATPAARGHSPHYDFRNSRFDITQKFAEGYDPDRIAAVFARDLGRAGEQRLQSGLEPAFGVL